MNFWHMQLGDSSTSPKKVQEILEKTSYIGLGVWDDRKSKIDDGESKIEQFKNDVNIDDVVAVKAGKTPIALVQIIGKVEYTKDVNKDLDWFEYRRKIKILEVYKDDEDKFEIPQARGTLNKCTDLNADTSKIIINWYKKILQMESLQKYIDLLKSNKSQIILQGPPGTGKTRLAKLIAKDLTQSRTIGSPESIIDSCIKNFNPDEEHVKTAREDRTKLLNKFYDRFPKENLNKLSLKDYCIGEGDNDNFCWWMERGLRSLGSYSPGNSSHYLIYYENSAKSYKKPIKYQDSNEELMEMIASEISKVVSTKNFNDIKYFGGCSLLLKVLNSYYPDEFFPIYSEQRIDNALKIFKIDFKGLDIFEKNKRLYQVFLEKKKQFNSPIDSFEFCGILFDNFNLKTGETINEKTEIVASGEYKIIQFHPAYSYEDFVRGIVAKTTETGSVSYHVENKILADFAKKAKDSPNDNYVLIIDEINRANLPAVLGELIYALEYRNEAIDSMYEYEGDRAITLPKNLFIIGTMNTADRSVGTIDYAIRRRFAFVDMLPEILDVDGFDKDLFKKVSQLFIKNYDEYVNNNAVILKKSEYLSDEFRPDDVWLGHSYFIMTKEEGKDVRDIRLTYEIIPILKEYLKDGILKSTAEKIINDLK